MTEEPSTQFERALRDMVAGMVESDVISADQASCLLACIAVEVALSDVGATRTADWLRTLASQVDRHTRHREGPENPGEERTTAFH